MCRHVLENGASCRDIVFEIFVFEVVSVKIPVFNAGVGGGGDNTLIYA